MAAPDVLQIRLNDIRKKIERAAEKSGRSAQAVTLVAVTKTVEPAAITAAVRLGCGHIAESRIQEAQEKRGKLIEPVVHHFIGSLQTNKARKAVELFDVIQSVDRPRLAESLDRLAGETGKKQTCLVEVKVSTEPTKSGLSLSDADEFLSGFNRYPHLVLTGLMTIAPHHVTTDEARAAFRSLKNLFDRYVHRFGSAPVLSMGMTDDFEMAIEEGSTMVRVGRGIFGERPLH